MPLFTLRNAALAYGHVPLLDHVDLDFQAGERVALIGQNGSGKSSLLKVLAKEVALDDGLLWRDEGMRVAYVPQEPVFDPAHSVFDALISGMGGISTLLKDYHDTSEKLAHEVSEEALLRLDHIQKALEHENAWAVNALATQALLRFSLNADQKVATLSGGQKKRLALAQALAQRPDLLLLDEPTNHLDMDAILWLEALLVSSSFSLLLVTHDRRFLDRVATRILELDRGNLVSFEGRFAAYQARKEDLLKDEGVAAAKFDKFLAQEEVWIRKGVEARRTRNEGRVRRLEALRRERALRLTRVSEVYLTLDAGEKSGKLVSELSHVSKSFGEGAGKIQVVRDFSCRIVRGDKIGLIGKNGSGKTTLLKLILGELLPEEGQVQQGTRQSVAYFDQFRTALDEEATLVEVISPGSDYIEIAGVKKHVMSYLEDFLFSPVRARSKVSSLSGGERNRLLLARLFARPANILVLDEPTNDLDIETLELLETLLADYAGTLFLVSHDRAFLDEVVTQTIASEGDGVWKEYVGGFSDWERQRTQKPMDNPKPKEAKTEVTPKRERVKKRRSAWEEKELLEMPNKIAVLEAEQKQLEASLSDPALYQGDTTQSQKMADRLHDIETELLTLMERWTILEEIGV